ncbi:GntR family transcriptional regulator [Paenibacillus sp. Marseille-Q4541]|uniref:GntR family transcriptional regulator n=1 Tax=Paenibacillus sp. Marseille-Q4541 TaxID=2831522 RepID=UPI001BA68DEF
MTLSRKKGPLYLQLKKIIRDRIVHGRYPIGSLIPSEPQLEQEFKVSKMTVRNAIQELQQEGYVLKQSGVGTTVLRNSTSPQMSKGKRFTEILVEQGDRIDKKLISKKVKENRPNDEAYTLFGPSCLCIERLYLLNEEPYIFYEHRLSSDLADQVEWNPGDEFSLYEWMEEQNLVADHYQDQFTVGPLPATVAYELAMQEGEVVLQRHRYTFDEMDRAIEWSIGYYKTRLKPYIVDYRT